jgi:hypothetical protein
MSSWLRSADSTENRFSAEWWQAAAMAGLPQHV